MATSKIEELSYDASGFIERYRFGPMKEREQKRQYASDAGPNASLPWVYYLLSGNKQQLAVYNGIEGRPCGGVIGSVYMWPVEYNAYGAGGGRVITRPDNSKMFVVTDHLGSVRLTYNAQGDVQETADYEPFGAVVAEAGEEARTGYIGRETDNESNLGFNGVRLYDQQYGRFLSTDKMVDKYRALQPFQYSNNSPITKFDDSGFTITAANADAQKYLKSFFESLFSVTPSFNYDNGVMSLSKAEIEKSKENMDPDAASQLDMIVEMINNTNKDVSIYALPGTDEKGQVLSFAGRNSYGMNDGIVKRVEVFTGKGNGSEFFISYGDKPYKANLVLRPDIMKTEQFSSGANGKEMTNPCAACTTIHALLDHGYQWMLFGSSKKRTEGVKEWNRTAKSLGETKVRDGSDHKNTGGQK